MTREITAHCACCGLSSRWPEAVYATTGGTCAHCLARQPGQVFALVMAEAGHGPYRSAPLRAPAMRWGLRGYGPFGALTGSTLGILFQAAWWPGHPWSHRLAFFVGTMLVNVGLWVLVFVRRVPR